MHTNERQTDKLGRRLRFATPLDDEKPIQPLEPDLIMFQWLDDHGPLPTSYLYEPIRHLRKNFKFHQKRLGKLSIRSTTPDNGRYIVRPDQQWASYRADRQELTHDLTACGRAALAKRGIALYPRRFDPMHHRLMNACCTASVRIAAGLFELDYITLKAILARHTCPSKTREAKKPLAITTKHGVLIPDDLSGLSYPTTPKKTYRFLAWEQDRATETLNAIELKMLCYLDVLRGRSYEGHWGITSLYVLIITTAPQRMRNMVDLLERLTKKEPHLRPFFLFKFKSEFANEWTVPPIMLDLLTDPWDRAVLPPFDLLKAQKETLT